MGQIVLGTNPPKIDRQRTLGLSGRRGSLAYTTNVIRNHIHSIERWMGLAAAPVGDTHRADIDSMTPFQIDAGNDTWGAWVQILGSEDSPSIEGYEFIDIHRILITEVETGKIPTRIQISFNSDPDIALSEGDYTEIMVIPEKATKNSPFIIKFPRVLSGTKFWARCWAAGQDTHTLDFFYGFHEYPG
jgi:hypothetical protein